MQPSISLKEENAIEEIGMLSMNVSSIMKSTTIDLVFSPVTIFLARAWKFKLISTKLISV